MDAVHKTTGQLPTPDTTPQRPRGVHFGARNGPGIGRGLPVHVLPKRHRKAFADNLYASFNKPSIRRLARRGGVKRISYDIYDGARHAVKSRIAEVLQRAVQLVQLKDRKTVTALDIVYALNSIGTPIYGFGMFEKAAPNSRAKEKRQLRARQLKAAREREQIFRENLQRRNESEECRNTAMERMDNWVRDAGGNVHLSQDVVDPFDEAEDAVIASIE